MQKLFERTKNKVNEAHDGLIKIVIAEMLEVGGAVLMQDNEKLTKEKTQKGKKL